MDLVGAIILGLVQALTEFLPVSSSGHLRLGHAWLAFEAEDDLLFDIILHVGTLIAVVWVYRESLLSILKDVFDGLRGIMKDPQGTLEEYEGLRMAILVVVATIPTGLIGVFAGDYLEGDVVTVPVVGALLLVNGTILWISQKAERERPAKTGFHVAGIGFKEALIIGVAQGFAILPGISRSGSTIVMALFLGAQRMRAAEFSFLLSIPAILGAVVLKYDPGALSAGDAMVSYLAGGIVAALVGVLALKFLLKLLKEAQFHHFAWYCWALGAGALVWAFALN